LIIIFRKVNKMSPELEKLISAPRLLMEVELQPVQGNRFQPTGFADLGAAIYTLPDGKTRNILVETAQSMANRMEQTCLDGGGPRMMKGLEGLPYILVKLTGASNAETSSLIEAHRINSPFIIRNDKFQKSFVEKSGYAKGLPLDWKKVGSALFFYDPNSLLHGAFLANLGDGRMKVPRAITGFIEAEDIREAASGGVKNNPLDPTGKIRAENYAENVYSNVPYHRMEYTAKRIVAYFNFDLALLDG
jgi:CRISPR-associated protein Csb1